MTTSNKKDLPFYKFYEEDDSNCPFKCQSVKRYSFDDPRLIDLMKAKEPVIITGSSLVKSAIGQWNVDYFCKHSGGTFNVYQSENNIFKYFNKNLALKGEYFIAPTTHHSLTFPQFVKLLNKVHRKNGKDRIYLQHRLTDAIGEDIKRDYVNFNWSWAERVRNLMGWGELTGNMLLFGQKGNVSPAHFDEQENLFAQILGRKRFYLFSPEQYKCFYPYPVTHPCDRQAQVNIYDPDYTRYPKFREAHAKTAILEPGDVLYIPMYWWHHVEILSSEPSSAPNGGSPEEQVPPANVSINFWYRTEPSSDGALTATSPTPQQRVAIMRNVEKILGKTVADTDMVADLLRTMSEGRFDYDDCRIRTLNGTAENEN